MIKKTVQNVEMLWKLSELILGSRAFSTTQRTTLFSSRSNLHFPITVLIKSIWYDVYSAAFKGNWTELLNSSFKGPLDQNGGKVKPGNGRFNHLVDLVYQSITTCAKKYINGSQFQVPSSQSSESISDLLNLFHLFTFHPELNESRRE